MGSGNFNVTKCSPVSIFGTSICPYVPNEKKDSNNVVNAISRINLIRVASAGCSEKSECKTVAS